MSNIKPNTFPLKLNLDGSEEIYTQTNGISEKFTLSQASSYITQNLDTWLYKELYLTGADLDAMFTTSFELLSETDLIGDEYYEVNRIIVESIIDEDNNVPHTPKGDMYVFFKTSMAVPFLSGYPDSSYFGTIPKSLIESTENLVFYFYSNSYHEEYIRLTGLYLDSDKVQGGGTSIFKIKIYYKIRS